MKHKNRSVGMIVLFILTVLVCLPRFNRNDFLLRDILPRDPGDAKYYVAYVQYFRGQAPLTEVPAPWSFRPLSPYIASFIPVSNPMTAINILNLLSLLVTIGFLYKLNILLGFGHKLSLLGCYLFSFSFPVFEYTTIGYVDVLNLLFIIISFYAILKHQWLIVYLATFIGSFSKEIVLIALPLALAYLFFKGDKYLSKVSLIFCSFIIPQLIIRHVFSGSSTYMWGPSLDTAIYNLRPKAFITVVLTIGLPGLLTMFYFLKLKTMTHLKNKPIFQTLLAGIVFSFALLAYSFVSASTDGRFVWQMVFFTIPFSLALIEASTNRFNEVVGPCHSRILPQ